MFSRLIVGSEIRLVRSVLESESGSGKRSLWTLSRIWMLELVRGLSMEKRRLVSMD